NTYLIGQTERGIHTRLFSRAFIMDDGSKRVVFITADTGMVSQRLRLEVILQELKAKYRDLYRQVNVVMSGTHKHSCMGDYFHYTLFMITSKGRLYKPLSHVINNIFHPLYEFNTDKQIVIMKFTDLDRDGMGLLSWFGIHPVSMKNTNRMVSSDNLGYASYAFEQEKNFGFLPGEGPFVASFSSSNLEDSSPNILEYVQKSKGLSHLSYCLILICISDCGVSALLYLVNLYSSAKQELHGPVYGAHQWVNMTDETVPLNSTHTGRTCKPALGHSFAAAIVDVQIITIGSVAIVAVPGEFTTMSGRRIREAVKKELEVKECLANAEVVISGLCNIYTHYITTYEEYQIQRYEGTSTIFDPHTLSALYPALQSHLCPEPPFFDEDKLFNQVKDPVADVAPPDTIAEFHDENHC
uniref:Neutral ceramidase n=1 Tax=Cyprinus carpio carpio TaxID=630221 RepID=A0A8C1BGD3_CYPCA